MREFIRLLLLGLAASTADAISTFIAVITKAGTERNPTLYTLIDKYGPMASFMWIPFEVGAFMGVILLASGLIDVMETYTKIRVNREMMKVLFYLVVSSPFVAAFSNTVMIWFGI